MIKKITKMALVCLAMLCMSSAQSPNVQPYVRVVFEYNEINVPAGRPVDIIIYFRNTYRLFVYREDNFTLDEIILSAENEEINNPDDKMITHTVVIDEPDHTVRYTVIAVSEDGSYMDTHVTYHTYQNFEP